MKALSIRQPWAWLICAGFKDVENRNWPTKYRGRVYIHASKTIDKCGWEWLCDESNNSPLFKCEAKKRELEDGSMGVVDPYDILMEWEDKDWDVGAIIGEVDIVSVMKKHPFEICELGHDMSMGDKQRELEYLKNINSPYFSPWFEGEYGFVLANPVLYEKPIPYRGQLGLFEVNDADIH